MYEVLPEDLVAGSKAGNQVHDPETLMNLGYGEKIGGQRELRGYLGHPR